MIVTLAERVSDSPYVEAVSYGYTASAGSTIRPAESHWHMVVVKHASNIQVVCAGPLTTSGIATWGEGAEILWIRFRVGTFMPHLPLKGCVDVETLLPTAASHSFWLKSGAWQLPDYENVETFIAHLVHDEVLVCDPVVTAVLQDQPHNLSPRTIRHRFLQATGMTRNQIYQIERAQRAALLLKEGVSILDTTYELGYFDQPHLTRSLKQWVGFTPAQLYRGDISCQFIQDSSLLPESDTELLAKVR
jgi:hypothetical protein